MDENEKKAGNCENTLDSRQWIHLHSFTPALSLAKFILRDLMLAEENSCKINFINKFYPIWTMKVDNWESFWVEEKQKQSNTAKLNIESSKCKKNKLLWNVKQEWADRQKLESSKLLKIVRAAAGDNMGLFFSLAITFTQY